MATIIDKLLLIPIAGLVLGNTALSALTGPFRGKDAAPTYYEHVSNTMLRTMLTYITIEQIQWISPAFTVSYESWCKKHSIKPDVVDIPGTNPPVRGFWIGSKSTAKYTMVYYHGGGFMAPGSSYHLDMLLRFVQFSNNNLAIFAVAYTLSPEAEYPTAIGQSVEGLRYILDLPGHSAATTLIGGDSAGGNLVLAVLSHISHPHPNSNVVRPLNLSDSLRGAMAIAPWTSSDSTKYASMTRFATRDIVNRANANYWIEAYKGRGKTIPDDEYICAVLAAPRWWEGTKCRDLLVCAGGEEGLVDAISDFVQNYKAGAGADKVKYVIGVRETHVQCLNPLPPAVLEKKGDSTQEGGIRLWIRENLA